MKKNKMEISKQFIKKIIIPLIAILAFLGIYYSPEILSLWPTIKPFEIDRDVRPIANIIQKDIYWFFKNQPKESFSEKHVLPYYLNKDYKFYVLRVRNTTAGFIIYKKLDEETGNINLIGIRHDFRKHGYAEKLLDFACKDLFKDGCNKIKLFTRTSNIGAIKLYEKMGFIETSKNDGFVYFEKYKI